MKRQIAWYNRRPYCWVASEDGGKTWNKLNADNDEDSSEAVDEACENYGGCTNEWEVMDECVLDLGKK